MAAEFFIAFEDARWRSSNLPRIEEKIRNSKTFVAQKDHEFWLLGNENRDQDGRWIFDVRFFTQIDERILLEISAHPLSIEKDLSSFFSWLRKQTEIAVIDKDGEPSGW